MRNYLASDFKIIFVDDDEIILDGLKLFFEDTFNILTSTNGEEILSLLESNEVGIVCSDFEMPKMSGSEVLEIVELFNSNIRRIMLTGKKDLDVIKNAINQGKVQAFVNKPVNMDDFTLLLIEEAENYLKYKEQEIEIKNLTIDAEKYRNEVYKRNNNLIELFSSGEEVFPINLIKVIQGFMAQNIYYIRNYRQSNSLNDLNKVKNVIDDIGSLATSCQDNFIKMYYYFLDANLHLLLGNLTQATMSFAYSERMANKIENLNLNYLLEFLSQFELDEDNIEKFDIKKSKSIILNQLEKLMEIDVADYINPNFAKLNLSTDENVKLFYIIVVKGHIPMYKAKIETKSKISTSLISNFIVAFADFAKEVFENEGYLENISHEGGVIIIHPHDNYRYICISNKMSMRLKLSLRQFADLSHKKFDKFKKYVSVTEDGNSVVYSDLKTSFSSRININKL